MRFIVSLLASAAIIPASASAQEAVTPVPSADERAAERSVNEAEIIVTALRRSERLQDVPVSVTAITAEDIRVRNVSNLNEMQYAVPGLSSFSYGPGLESIQLRGVSNSLGAPTVGVYVDETPTGGDFQGGALDIRLLDMERVEVLRGPQATLYGEGSMGGTIRYITANPHLDRMTGSVDGEYSWTKDGAPNYQLNGVFSVPVVKDKLGLRLVAGYERFGGYIDNVTTGARDDNDATIKTFRGKLLAQPSERLMVSLLGLYQESDQTTQDFGVNRKTTALLPFYNRDRYGLGQLIVEYDFGGARLTGSTSYFERTTDSQYDLSPFYVPFLTAPAPFGFGFPIGFITTVGLAGSSKLKGDNTELRIASNGSGPFTWVFGAVRRNLSGSGVSSSKTGPNTLPFDILSGDSSRHSKSSAIYGELGYSLTPRLTVTAGLRYFEDEKRLNSKSTSFGFPSVDVNRGKFDSLNPRLNVRYEFSRDSMVYANAAKGFRSGGFNFASSGGGVFTVPPTYGPDQIWTYEAGTKHQLFDGKMSIDADVYYSDWKDVQSSSFLPGSAITVVNNSGRVKGWGVDASLAARPARGLTLTGTYGWNNLEYKVPGVDKLKGDPVDNAVRESYSASIDYRHPIGPDTTGFFRADYQHASKAQITLRNFGGQVIDRPKRDLVNLRLGVNFRQFEIAAFANNLVDEDAPNIVGPFGVLLENLEQRPRVIGLSARAQF